MTNTTEYSACLHDKTACKLCIANQGDGICNAGEFPRSRRKCIRCNSTAANCPTQDNPESINQYSVYCRNIMDACAVIIYGYQNISQNCASEITESDQTFCAANQNQCLFCSDTDNCNLISTETTPTVTPSTTTTAVQPSTTTTTKNPNNAIEFVVNRMLLALSTMLSSILSINCFLLQSA